MKIRTLMVGAALGAALVITAIPASADEAPAPSSTVSTAADLGWGSPTPGSTPTPSPTARPSDLGWG